MSSVSSILVGTPAKINPDLLPAVAPPAPPQTLSQLGNSVSLSGGGGSVDISLTTSVASSAQKTTAQTYNGGLLSTTFSGDLFAGRTEIGKPIEPTVLSVYSEIDLFGSTGSLEFFDDLAVSRASLALVGGTKLDIVSAGSELSVRTAGCSIDLIDPDIHVMADNMWLQGTTALRLDSSIVDNSVSGGTAGQYLGCGAGGEVLWATIPGGSGISAVNAGTNISIPDPGVPVVSLAISSAIEMNSYNIVSTGALAVQSDVSVVLDAPHVYLQGIPSAVSADTLYYDSVTKEVSYGSATAGPEGPTGPQGVEGATGPQGVEGATGPQGVEGATGPQGVEGATGPQGVEGATGPQGVEGATGPQGVEGATGPQGVEGPTGPQGVEGATGPQGSTGSTGAQGPIGPAGAVAASSVYVNSAVAGPGTGTLADPFNNIPAGIALVTAGGTLFLTGTFNYVASYIISKAGIKIANYGSASIVWNSLTGPSGGPATDAMWPLTGAGIVLEGLSFSLPVQITAGTLNFIRMDSINQEVRSCSFIGPSNYNYNTMGNVTRGLEISTNQNGGLVTDNQFSNVRQPIYVNGGSTALLGNIAINNNVVSNTKGFVVAGPNTGASFSNNSWGAANFLDIVLLSSVTVGSLLYTDLITLSQDNNGALIQDQRVATAGNYQYSGLIGAVIFLASLPVTVQPSLQNKGTVYTYTGASGTLTFNNTNLGTNNSGFFVVIKNASAAGVITVVTTPGLLTGNSAVYPGTALVSNGGVLYLYWTGTAWIGY